MRVQTPGAPNQGAAAKAQPPATAGRAWLIVALLFLFMLINFADKR
jgi:hypothetical protein